ncbi:MAG: DHH family phosphoesterase [Clostridia bacterium]|nr:DHH family phosphoesterase [Clostridia bacterium]
MKHDNNRANIIHIPYASRFEIVLYVSLACFNIALVSVLISIFPGQAVLPAILVTLGYLVEVAIVAFRRGTKAEAVPKKNIHMLLSEDSSIVFKNTTSPVIAFNSLGTILWYNDAMRETLDSYENYVAKNITSLFGITPDNVSGRDVIVNLEKSVYKMEGFAVSDKGDGLYIALLTDITELRETERKYLDEKVAVAYIAIDNVEDVLQYVHDKYADAVTRTEEKLKAWAASMNGIIKSYDKDKYIMLFDSVYLDKCIENRFSILDEIRDSRVGDGVSITVSVGVSRSRDTLSQRELDARDAIDLALQRGGDQAVYKSEDGTAFYGGRTKTVYKRSNVKSRSFASQLTALMVRSDNVVIMGHRYGDFDSIGASVGVARLAMLCGVKANIAIDLHDKNLRPCIEMMQKTNMYSEVFVDNAYGLDLLGPDTLVILVDHGSVGRAQFSDIAAKAGSIAIVDHHRKTDNISDVIKLSYIEPSASSTCELVTEMLESTVSSQNLIKEEADLLLAGILLDTKQFTRNTGTRTFGAAQYLRGAGANPTDVYNLFKTVPEDLSKEARFHTSITMYRGCIAISSCDGETDESFRIIASKAADKMLTLRGVEAAFTLVRIGEQIHISARSSGQINVQLILERMGGGGHFDVAGAQIVSDSIAAVLSELKYSIDAQFND